MARQFFALKEHLPQATLDRLVEIGVPFNDAVPLFLDLVGFHEIGHIFARDYGAWPTEKWLNEFTATYLAYAFMAESRPRMALVWDTMCGALGTPSGQKHTSRADFEKLHIEEPRR